MIARESLLLGPADKQSKRRPPLRADASSSANRRSSQQSVRP